MLRILGLPRYGARKPIARGETPFLHARSAFSASAKSQSSAVYLVLGALAPALDFPW